jgi:hypothetical protein
MVVCMNTRSDPGSIWMSDEDATARAAGLAEWIIDEVSSADQDWCAVQRCARELAELAAQAAGSL